jgi:hypothetical protein
MTTARDNMIRLFRGERPEWIPLTGHCDPYNQPDRDGMDPALAAALGTVKWHDTSTVLYSRALGLDILDYMPAPVRTTHRRCALESFKENGDNITLWHTPAGDLRQARRLAREDGTAYTVEHMVKSADDLPALAALFEDEVMEANPEIAESIRQRRALIGEDGLLMCFLAGTPLGMMYRSFCRVETLAYLSVDAPDALVDLFAVMERSYRRTFELTAAAGFDALVGMDDTSTTVISPAMFEAHNLALTDARADLCHQAGALYFHHSCGLIHDLLPLYHATRMDAVHAFTEPPIGNVALDEGRRLLGERIAIIAGVPVISDPTWNEADVRRSCRALYERAGGDPRLILSLPGYPHRTMAQTAFIAAECRRHSPPLFTRNDKILK